MANVVIKDGNGATVNVSADTDSGGVELQRIEIASMVASTITPNGPTNPISAAVADGGDATQGAQADAAWSGAGSGSVVAVLKAIWTRLRGGQAVMASSLPVTVASDQVVNVAAASLPLPNGGATSALQTAGNTSLSTLAVNLPAQGQKTMAGSLPVALASDQGAVQASLAAGENHAGSVGGSTKAISGSFARPANTTAYAANAVVSNSTVTTSPLQLAHCARINAGSGYVTKARLWTNSATVAARFRVHLFNVNSPTVGADGAAYALLWANRTLKVGSLTLAAMTTEGAGSDSAHSDDITDSLGFVCATGDDSLYAVIETLDAFTPASGQLFWLELTCEQN